MRDTTTLSAIPHDQTILRTVTRPLPGRRFIVAQVGLHKLTGNAKSYWSATGALYEPHGTWSGEAQHRNGREPDSCGAIDIARYLPKLAPIVALHLSDPDGVPMHAEANAAHHTKRGNPELAASLLRVTIDELPQDPGDIPAFAAALRPTWRAQSEAAYALLLTLELDQHDGPIAAPDGAR